MYVINFQFFVKFLTISSNFLRYKKQIFLSFCYQYTYCDREPFLTQVYSCPKGSLNSITPQVVAFVIWLRRCQCSCSVIVLFILINHLVNCSHTRSFVLSLSWMNVASFSVVLVLNSNFLWKKWIIKEAGRYLQNALHSYE